MNRVKIIWHMVLEYILVIRMHVLWFLIRPPQSWNTGDKGDIILLQGYFVTWVYFRTIADVLNLRGYRIHVLHEMDWNLKTIDECVELVERYVEEKKLKTCILLSFSKGGLVAKRFIDTTKHPHMVRLAITLASPYHGTLFGYLRLFTLDELKPGNKKLQQLLAIHTNNHKIINIYASVDNHIIPNTNAILEEARNIQLDVIGHTRLLEDEKTMKEILNILSLFGKNL